MEQENKSKLKKPYVYVKDDNGVVYICKRDDLKDPDKLTPEEMDSCMLPPGDA